MTKLFNVDVLKRNEDLNQDDYVVKTLGPHPEREAERIERGLNRNLNHAQYWTRIQEVTEAA